MIFFFFRSGERIHETQVGLIDRSSHEINIGSNLSELPHRVGEDGVHKSENNFHRSRKSIDSQSTSEVLPLDGKDMSLNAQTEPENASFHEPVSLCLDTKSSHHCQTTWRTVLTEIDRHIEFSLLKNIRFLCFCISCSMFTTAFTTVYIYIPPLAKGCGITELDAAYLISTAGVSDIFGRTILSTTFDITHVRPHRDFLNALLLLMLSGVAFAFTFMTTFVGFAVVAGMHGFLSGGYVSQKSIVILDILGRSKHSSSLGLVLLFQGLGVVIGPPLAGTLQHTHTHILSYLD